MLELLQFKLANSELAHSRSYRKHLNLLVKEMYLKKCKLKIHL